MTESDYYKSPNSRFKVYPSPVASPGKCGVCGAVDRPVVDFNMTIQFYGAVYICVTCMCEAAQAIDMVSADQLRDAQNSLAQSFDRKLKQLDMVAIPNGEYRSIALALRGVLDLVLSNGTSDYAVVAEFASDPNQNIFDFDGDAKSEDHRVIEQSDNHAVGEGPTFVPASNGNGVKPKSKR